MRPHVVGAQAVTSETWAKVAALREDARTAMRIIDELLGRPGAPPQLLRAVAAAKQANVAANAERDGVYQRLASKPADDSALRALSSEEWNEICVNKLFPVLMSISSTALNLIGQRAAGTEHDAAVRLFLVIAGLVGVGVVSAFALWQVRQRIMRPVKLLTDAIEHLTRRDYSKPVPQLPQRDEFGGMATTLEALRLGALEVEKAASERQHSQKLEALGTLAGGIAHDLNNTLVPVLTLAKLTARHLPEGGRERTNLETIHTAGMRARDLVKQILAFARREQVEKQPVDLAALTREALRLLRASIPATIRIIEDIDDVPPVLGDAGQLHQVIINIATNGAQAIDGRIGQLTVSLKESRRRDSITNQKLVTL
jgi:signal transduction histidine kinase